ncbi:uncharacterized protein LOC142024251 isoform X2 [Carettochelys insculpta]|uniref:uncharacterized protein LOC142024251 isoform X2 n=1 Tax=Carettochelys insculpta TaxID=44489 RepID=UPI003EBF3686
MSGNGGDRRTPPPPAAKRRRPGPPLLKEAEAAQALTQLTAGGGLETAARQGALGTQGRMETDSRLALPAGVGSLETATAQPASLETSGRRRGSPEAAGHGKWEQETTEAGSSPRGATRRLEAATEQGSLETTAAEKGVLETTITKMGRLETATCQEKDILETSATKVGRLDTASAEEMDLETAATNTGRRDTASPEAGGVLETATTNTGRLDAASHEEKQVLEATEERRKSRVEEGCSIVAVGEDEDDKGATAAQPAPRTEQYLEELEEVQLQLEAVNEQAGRAFRCLKAKFSQVRRPHLERRNAIIQNIPGFWVTAFLNHPQLSAMITDRDEDTLSYMSNLQVEELTHSKSGCKIKFYFGGNPYFQNEVIVKEFQAASSGWCPTPPPSAGGGTRTPRPTAPRAPRWGAASSPGLPTTASLPGTISPSGTENGEDCVLIVDDEDEDVQEIMDEEDGQ